MFKFVKERMEKKAKIKRYRGYLATAMAEEERCMSFGRYYEATRWHSAGDFWAQALLRLQH